MVFLKESGIGYGNDELMQKILNPKNPKNVMEMWKMDGILTERLAK